MKTKYRVSVENTYMGPIASVPALLFVSTSTLTGNEQIVCVFGAKISFYADHFLFFFLDEIRFSRRH